MAVKTRTDGFLERNLPPVLEPGYDDARITDVINDIPLRRGTPLGWILVFAIAICLSMLLLFAVSYLFVAGIGIWGVMIPVAWGFAITNFVWWVGIGHAGTLISAVLLLLKQQVRTSINRFAEAMTIFAVVQAGLFPVLHLGRPWFFYWLIPYPSTMGVWPQFRSPLVWDFFAVSTYLTVSFAFWYLGMLPDPASIRDQATHRLSRVFYGIFALGWRGDVRHWQHYEKGYYLLAALATPLVVSVHSVVSADFAVAIVPGWHSTIFPPYFVAGAIYSGFAMVLTIAIPLRAAYGLKDFVTLRHIDTMAKYMLVSGLIVSYSYVIEAFMAWYSGNIFEQAAVMIRAFGPYASLYWTLIFCNVVIAQTLWFRRVRTSSVLLFVVSLLINLGMWLERFVIVVVSLSRDYLPSAWGIYTPTFWDWATLAGTGGLFVVLLLLFVRFVPMISAFEMRRLWRETRSSEATP